MALWADAAETSAAETVCEKCSDAWMFCLCAVLREMAHRELAQKTLLQLCADCEDIAVVEKKPMMEGRMMQVWPFMDLRASIYIGTIP